MNFKEAVQELKNGNNVRRKTWYQDCHLAMKEEKLKSFIREAVPFLYDLTIINSNDWVVCGDDEEKQIDFTDAVEQLMQNRLVRLKEWPKSAYLKMEPNKKEFYLSRISEFDYLPTCEDFISKDWEIFNV